jgi:hypothetical protein
MFQLPETVIVEKKDHVLHFYGPLGKKLYKFK